jgi:beta-mannan synthase
VHDRRLHAGDLALRAGGDRLLVADTVAAVVESLVQAWRQVRMELLVPLLRGAVVACMVMSVIVLAEKVFLGVVSAVVKLLRRRPARLYRCDPVVVEDDDEAGRASFPMVLVQIPMYNEKEVTWLSISSELCHFREHCSALSFFSEEQSDNPRFCRRIQHRVQIYMH